MSDIFGKPHEFSFTLSFLYFLGISKQKFIFFMMTLDTRLDLSQKYVQGLSLKYCYENRVGFFFVVIEHDQIMIHFAYGVVRYLISNNNIK